jgi:Hydrazine synthase alpha subunit middle domain
MSLRASLVFGAAALLLAGCHPEAPEGSLVLTLTPVGAPPPPHATVLDVRYPRGSRVILLVPPFRTDTVRELSHGLVAAGDPCVSWDGRWVYFAGKSSNEADWQIYKVNAGGGRPERVTRMPGGAMDPAIAAHGELVFSSPVPKAGRLWTAPEPAALYRQMPDQAPNRLTFCEDSAVGTTVLRDGRILFVSAKPRDDHNERRHLCLFTINNDGTEMTAYACQEDGVDFIQRPRELGNGLIAFLAGRTEELGPMGQVECVRPAAPFATRGSLFAFRSAGCRSVEPTAGGDVLACVETSGWVGRSMISNAAIYRVAADATAIGAPLFDDPQCDSIEAARVAARDEPAGHTSAVMPGAPYGTLLCLDVNYSSEPATGQSLALAAELRVFASVGPGQQRILGGVPVASDGSVIVQLPVDVPLGFDTLDAQGHVLRHQPASFWIRPGENRACIGCHEPRNHAPRNVRPLATTQKPAHLGFTHPTTVP